MDNCIIHCDEKSTDFVSPKTLSSWQTLLRAAQIRKYKPVLELAKDLSDEEIPDIQYHRRCRSIFTMKNTLDAMIERTNSDEVEKSDKKEDCKRQPREVPSTSRVYDEHCIFCEKKKQIYKRILKVMT